ncbi:MAG TPA: dihydropteroate synthase [Gemmatimonadaceae bacterium]|nr:dihydropteroate synthase [Gemmatimonadaceae bacterium]
MPVRCAGAQDDGEFCDKQREVRSEKILAIPNDGAHVSSGARLSMLQPPRLFERPRARTLVMGVLNVTPDSFSDGGQFMTPAAAIARARVMIDEGADIIDVGAESTRPGHAPISADEELNRLLPVLEQLAPACSVPISVDTTKAIVARRAIASGAAIINDQWGLQGDSEMALVAAEHEVPVIAMHNQRGRAYDELMADVIGFLRRSLDIADRAGLGRERVIVDPGFGFAKTPEQNLEVLRRLDELMVLERPILVGTSRKSMIGRVLTETTADDRVEGTAATVAIAIAFGADIVRVHDVRAMSRVARMADAVMRLRPRSDAP